VKVLRLDKKQMTLATFRQLPERGVFAPQGPDVRLCGVPWGYVRYKWSGSPAWADYHLVWQGGDRLYRRPLSRKEDLKEPLRWQRTNLYGCPRCGGKVEVPWGGIPRCDSCHTSKVPVGEWGLEPGALLLLRQLHDDDFGRLCDLFARQNEPAFRACYAELAGQLEAFERLDQLFISV
jgi:hypothetical protein